MAKKKLSVLGIILLMFLGLFAGCESAQEEQIKKDYLAYRQSLGDEMTIKDVKILRNYGTYNGAVVLRFENSAYGMITTIQVGGIDFTFNNSNIALVWKDGQFFSLEKAYQNGFLTKDNLKALAKKVNR